MRKDKTIVKMVPRRNISERFSEGMNIDFQSICKSVFNIGISERARQGRYALSRFALISCSLNQTRLYS
jgi:hypothetical protein